jgi:hypothetical protein
MTMSMSMPMSMPMPMSMEEIIDLLSKIACGVSCVDNVAEYKSVLQEDDADLWSDLTFQNWVPHPKSPKIPDIVSFDEDVDDGVSDICSLRHGDGRPRPRAASGENKSNGTSCNSERDETPVDFGTWIKDRYPYVLKYTSQGAEQLRSVSQNKAITQQKGKSAEKAEQQIQRPQPYVICLKYRKNE